MRFYCYTEKHLTVKLNLARYIHKNQPNLPLMKNLLSTDSLKPWDEIEHPEFADACKKAWIQKHEDVLFVAYICSLILTVYWDAVNVLDIEFSILHSIQLILQSFI